MGGLIHSAWLLGLSCMHEITKTGARNNRWGRNLPPKAHAPKSHGCGTPSRLRQLAVAIPTARGGILRCQSGHPQRCPFIRPTAKAVRQPGRFNACSILKAAWLDTAWVRGNRKDIIGTPWLGHESAMRLSYKPVHVEEVRRAVARLREGSSWLAALVLERQRQPGASVCSRSAVRSN